jgi:hypothetical protein
MATILSKFAKNQLATIVADGAGDIAVNDFYMDLTAAQINAGDVIDIGVLPAYHTVSDAILIADDLDSNGTPTIALDVGIMSGTPGDAVSVRTCGAEIFAAANTAQAGGIARPTLASAFKILSTQADRSIGVKFATGSATAAAGRIRLRVFIHPSDQTTQF